MYVLENLHEEKYSMHIYYINIQIRYNMYLIYIKPISSITLSLYRRKNAQTSFDRKDAFTL